MEYKLYYSVMTHPPWASLLIVWQYEFAQLRLYYDNRNGIKQRKNSWQDGVLGTNCPIPPNSNYTYNFQPKDQIGSYTYFPSTGMHRAAGGFGALNVYSRPRIPVPYATPDGDFTLLVGDWYKTNYKVTRLLCSITNEEFLMSFASC